MSTGAQLADGLPHQTEAPAHRPRQGAPNLGQKHATPTPLEQRHIQFIFEQTHSATDRAVGQMQLVGRATEIFQPSRGFEAPQRQQRRQALIDG